MKNITRSAGRINGRCISGLRMLSLTLVFLISLLPSLVSAKKLTDVTGEELDFENTDLRIMLLRTYLPTDGRDNVPLPTLTYTRNGKSVELPECPWRENTAKESGRLERLFTRDDATPKQLLRRLIKLAKFKGLDDFPFCSWSIVVDNLNFNIAFPDAAATYWATPLIADDDVEIVVEGEFADQRYMSLTLYDQQLNPYLYVNGGETFPSYLADYEIQGLDPGSNPFRHYTGEIGAKYKVKIVANPEPGDTNVLPWYETVDDSLELGDSGFPMPPPCNHPSSEFTCTLSEMFSSPPKKAQSSVFSNPHNTYIPAAMDFSKSWGDLQMKSGKVYVIRGKLPTTPPGTSPVQWPNEDYQMRYWSLCTAIYVRPYPTIGNLTDKDRKNTGCVADTEIARTDADGTINPSGDYFTVVLSTEKDKPDNITGDPLVDGVTWLETVDFARVLVILRNMLPAADFEYAAQNIQPKDGDWKHAHDVMQEYYPAITTACTTRHYENNGWGGCVAPKIDGLYPEDPDGVTTGAGLPGAAGL